MMTNDALSNKKVRLKKVYEPYYSYEEIATEIGITREAVQIIEKRALRKIAKALVVAGYFKEDFI